MEPTQRRIALALAPLIALASARRGIALLIAADLSKRVGKKQDPSGVRLYLHADLRKRIQPRLGVGLFLMDIQDEINRGVWNMDP